MDTMIIYVLLGLGLVAPSLTTIPRPRGVEASMASFYKPDVPFRCLDGSKQVPFEYVNDDYCDCDDGSDEPGTSACPSGKFHCTNTGHSPKYILSSRVNDGICDCCDGTDEWSGNIDCVNNCAELGQKMREEQDRVRLLQEEGYKTRLTYSEQGKKTREEKKAELERLQKEKEQLEVVKMEMEEKKTAAEEPEKEAKDRHTQAWEEVKEKRRAEKEQEKGQAAFNELDTNNDQRVDLEEMKTHPEFDIDSNGEVSDDEAKEHLEERDTADLEHFLEKVWPNIKQVYKVISKEDQAKGENQVDRDTEEITTPPPDNDEDDEEGYGDDDDEEEEEESEPDVDKTQAVKPVVAHEPEGVLLENDTQDKEEEKEESMPEYDEETKRLIEVADEARKQFNEADSKLRETDNQINQINSYLGLDYGPEEEFSVLKGQCFEYTDREYTYKLCPFERASQRPKNGGSETTLGNWGHWEGPSDNKYSAMKYDRGQNCWNGPDRSVKVNLMCGLEHKVTNAFEPSRCEYEFDFSTPASCSQPSLEHQDKHDEL